MEIGEAPQGDFGDVVRRAMVRALAVWLIPAGWMLATRVVEVAQHGTDYRWLVP